MPIRHSASFAVLFGLLFQIPIAASGQSEIEDQFLRRSYTANDLTLPYRLFVPTEYDSTQSYPLVLALHGGGQVGTNNEHISSAITPFATAWAEPETQSKWPSFVLAPQVTSIWANQRNPVSRTPELEITIEILDSLATEFNIDQDRLYVIGLSRGGFGVLAFLFHYPDRFAAGVPLAGGFGREGGFESTAVDGIGDTPLWVAHGESDTVVPTKLSRLLVSEFERHGRIAVYTHCGPSEGPVDCHTMSPGAIDSVLATRPNLLYSGYPGEGHSRTIVGLTYENPQVQRWLFQQFLLKPEAIKITAPFDYSRFTDVARVEWVAHNPTDTVEVWFSPDLGASWELVTSDVMESGAHEFDTSSLSETAFGQFRVLVRNKRGFVYGRAESTPFIIDRPGNAKPQVDLLDFDFRGRRVIEGPEYTLTVRAADAESASLATTVLYSADGGDTFESAGVLELQGRLEVQEISIAMARLANSDRAVFSVVVSDGDLQASDATPVFHKATR